MSYEQAYCPGCGQHNRREGRYLCPRCWYILPLVTRRRLSRRDDRARSRLTELVRAIRGGTPLGEIQVAA